MTWFLPAPLVLCLLLVGSNFYFFGSVAGGQDQLEQHHRLLHGVGGPWSGDLREGLAGTLFSPNRGLFIFSPWVALAVAVLPWSIRKVPPGSLARWLMLALVPYLFLFSKYAVWWAGGSFGPRYWTDAMPVFGIMLAAGFDWAWERSRVVMSLFAAAVVFAMAIHAIGAFCYPSTWNFYPTDIDIDHRRLWDCATRNCRGASGNHCSESPSRYVYPVFDPFARSIAAGFTPMPPAPEATQGRVSRSA